MPTDDAIVEKLRSLLDHAERVEADCDAACSEGASQLFVARRELAAAKRAVKSLSGGTPTMQTIGKAVADQIDQLAEVVEATTGGVAALRGRRRQVSKATELLRAALEERRPPNDALVRPVVAKLVEENDGLTYEEVYALVSDKLIADSQPRIGLGLQVRRVLVALGYEADDAGVYHAKRGAEAGAVGGTPPRPRSDFPAESERRGHPIVLEQARQ